MSQNVIEGAMARLLWALAWADAMEEAGRSREMSGKEITHIMPPVPPLAYRCAERIAGEIEGWVGAQYGHVGGRSLHVMFTDAWKEHTGAARAREGASDEDRVRFGECLVYQYVGHGVSWTDDHNGPALRIPHGESPWELCELAAAVVALPQEAECTYTVSAEVEEEDPYGNVIACGDENDDRAEAERVKAEVRAGDVWEWASVTVSCTHTEHDGVGKDLLGCCSYDSKAEFVQDGYYADMKASAYRDLLEQWIADLYRAYS